MKNNFLKNKYFCLFLISILAIILRFYKLNEVPLGFHMDEVSQAYNSFSILNTGRDRYDQYFPILFRSFGSYQPPVYTYLTPVAIFLFGNTMFAARSTSALFGVFTVALTYFLVDVLVNKKHKNQLSLLASFFVAISPWAIHFSRRVVEGNLGLFFFLLALYLLIKSTKKIQYFIFASIVLGISTHAYYSERLTAVLFLPFFLLFHKNYFLKHKKQVIYGLIAFALVLLPHFVTVLSGAFFARLGQVGSHNQSFVLEFFKHMLGYFSPFYLFTDAGSGLARVSPGIGIFYNWLFIPFLAGLYFLPKVFKRKDLKFLAISVFIFLIPTSLTGDVFYPLRALEFFWLLTLIISVGVFEIAKIIKNKLAYYLLFLTLIAYSLLSFYVSYFVFFQYEATENAGNTYSLLLQQLENYKDKKVIIDSTRDPAVGLRIAYFYEYNTPEFRLSLKDQMQTPYYSSLVNMDEKYEIDNIITRAINWKEDRCFDNTLLVGDALAISENQIKEHNLTKVFSIKGVNNAEVLYGYLTNPDEKCKLKL